MTREEEFIERLTDAAIELDWWFKHDDAWLYVSLRRSQYNKLATISRKLNQLVNELEVERETAPPDNQAFSPLSHWAGPGEEGPEQLTLFDD
jgi:uncharacterized protein YprB with RNaseH-like and TPR domain